MGGRRLNQIALIFGLLISLAFLGRLLVIRSWTNEVRKLAYERILTLKTGDPIDVKVLDFSRGDFQITLRKPPLQPMSWTLNRYSGQVIPWGSDH